MQKKLNKSLLFCVILCLVCVSLTVAFFSISKTANNVITFGNLKMKILQTTIDENGEEVQVSNDDSFDITENSSISRMIKVKNIGKHNFFLRVSLNMIGTDEENNTIDVSDLVSYDLNEEKWIYKDGWYYYKDALAKDEVTDTLITCIIFNTDKITAKYPNSKFKFKVNAEAVQAENNESNVLEAVGWPSN